ncbi:MAG: hypothetical protein HDS15_00960 [Bacteroides sp.]|nr:hypothetical protein [Bacteroides sp.]
MKKPILIRVVITIGLALCFWLAYTRWLDYVLFYQEQHRLMVYTADAVSRRISSAGVIELVNDFIAQFFYIPWLGALILSLLCSSVYFLGDLLIRKVLRRPDYLGVAPAASVVVFLSTTGIDSSLVCAWLVPLCLCVLLLLSCLLPRRTFKGNFVFGSAVLALIYGGAGYWWLLGHINRSERTMILTEKAVKEGRWSDVVKRAEAYADAGHSNKLMLMFRSLALANQGRLLDNLFDVPQNFGINGLFLPWNSDVRESEYGYLVYEAIGHINEAHHWESEALVAWGPTAPHLINLAHYNIAMGRPEVARRFIRPLEHTLFYRDEAKSLNEQLENGMADGIRYSIGKEGASQFTNVMNIIPELQAVCNSDQRNAIARQYLLAAYLLTNRVGSFVAELPCDNRPLAPASQQALLVYRLKDDNQAGFDSLRYAISQETVERFSRYAERSSRVAPAELARQFGDTYWFYINYISPHGHKVND